VDDVLLAELPAQLDISQFMRFGAANTYIANTDGPLFKDNNWYYYGSREPSSGHVTVGPRTGRSAQRATCCGSAATTSCVRTPARAA